MTDDAMARLRGLMNTATPGPWKREMLGHTTRIVEGACNEHCRGDMHFHADIPLWGSLHPGGCFTAPFEEAVANQNLIVAAINALPVLLDAAEAVREWGAAQAMLREAPFNQPGPYYRAVDGRIAAVKGLESAAAALARLEAGE